jgi:recombination protein RecT
MQKLSTNLISDFTVSIEKYEKNNLLELLQGSSMTPQKFKQIVISELTKSPKLQQAFVKNPSSFFASILTCAELDLNPSAIIGEFFFSIEDSGIIPIIGYKGLVTLLMRSERVKKIWTEVVYDGDDFEYELGLKPDLVHIPNHNTDRTANNIKFVYACAKLDDEIVFKVMSKKDIQNIISMSKITSEFYFNDKKNPERWMEKKTVLKQLAKLMPKDDDRIKRALSIDDNVEGGGYLIMDEKDSVSFVQGTVIGKKNSIYEKLTKGNNR